MLNDKNPPQRRSFNNKVSWKYLANEIQISIIIPSFIRLIQLIMKKLILFIITVSLFGCSKPVGTFYHISDALKADFNFQKGSYWIYRDSLSGITDSVVVSQYLANTVSTTPHNPAEAVHTDYIDISISNYQIAPMFWSADTINWSFQLSPGGIDVTYTKYNPDLYPDVIMATDGTMAMSTPYPFVATVTLDSCGIDSLAILRNFSLNNEVYATIGAKFSASFGCIFTPHYTKPFMSYSDQIYFCPKVGIVKMRLNHPLDSVYRVWELVRHSVKL